MPAYGTAALAASANKALSVSAAQLPSGRCRMRCVVTNPYDSGIVVAIGSDNTVTMAKGKQLLPGESFAFYVGNSNELWAIAASGTPTIGIFLE